MVSNAGFFAGEFKNVEDVMYQFEISEQELSGVTILLAEYETPSYEGYAFVLFEKAGKLYEVHGSHCSCYGLEGQWVPEEVLLEELKKRTETHDGLLDVKEPLQAILELFETCQGNIDAVVVAMRLMYGTGTQWQ